MRTCRFVLYSRSYCHLCEDMLNALMALQTAELRFDVAVIDVDADADPALVERFDELVPVLFGQPEGAAEPVELCHYFLDPAAVQRHLAQMNIAA